MVRMMLFSVRCRWIIVQMIRLRREVHRLVVRGLGCGIGASLLCGGLFRAAEEPAEEPASEWLDQFTAEELFEEVCHLPEGYRTIFNLYYLEGLSHREIADLMGIRERSSSSQLARARTALARRLMNKKRNNHDKE